MADEKPAEAVDRGNNLVPNETGTYNEPVQGTDADGREVTVQIGINEREGETLISEGLKNDPDFKGEPGSRGHDHANPANDYQSERGQYNG